MKTRRERAARPILGATAAFARLGDLPLGSLQSRAAARSLLEQRETVSMDEEIRFRAVDILTGKPIDWYANKESTDANCKAK